jgi:hypothetical protein
VCKVICKGDVSGTTWANIFHVFLGTGGSPITQLMTDTLVTAFHNIYAATLQHHKVAADFLRSTEVVALDSLTAPSSFFSHDDPGATAGNGLPANAAMCVSWQIARRYRGGNPRTYLSGSPVGYCPGGGTFTPAATSTVENEADLFLNQINSIVLTGATQVHLCCVHYLRLHTLLVPPLVDLITGERVDSRICSQRRRVGKQLLPLTE